MSDHDPGDDAENEINPHAVSIFGDSEPPNQEPQVIAASSHVAAHPFWDQRGRGNAKKKDGAQQKKDGAEPINGVTSLIVDEDRPMFTGISLRELEFVRRRNADGAESSVASEDGDELRRRGERKRRRLAEIEKDKEVSDEARLAAAAFGYTSAGGLNISERINDDSARQHNDEEDLKDDDDNDFEDDVSMTHESSTIEQCGSFPIRGESCIGCVYDRSVVGKVDTFVREHCSNMTETALYRAASLFWNIEVVQPRASEGVKTPKWHWKDLANHYELHSVDAVLQRTALVRTLGAMRSYHAQSILRVNPDGSKQLDAKAADLMLKLVDKQDKQLSALDAAKMPPPPPRMR